MLSDIRNYIASLGIADAVTIGKIDDSKTNVIGIYGDGYNRRIESIGLHSSYDVAGLRILYHGTKNLKDTEAIARSLYSRIRYITHTTMGNIHIQYLDLQYDEPVFVGTDSLGVYEYVIPCVLYYRRG